MPLAWLLTTQKPHFQRILEAAERLRDQNEHTAALITAHTAAEICCEQVISAAFRRRGIEDLEESVTALFSSYNVGDERVRRVYTALTGDAIQHQAFWSAFQVSRKIRNDAVHRGQDASSEEAKRACEVVRELTSHIRRVVKSLNMSSAPEP
jgi:hypothetical protein